MEATIEIKVGDVFRAQYTAAYRSNNKGRDLNHCFEGLCVARLMAKTDASDSDQLVLVDTFWGINRTDNKWFTLDQVGVDIDIEFYCNLNELVSINALEARYYKPEDIFLLHDQHACVESCKYYYKRLGAERDRNVMRSFVDAKIEEAKRKINSLISDIQWHTKQGEEIERAKDLNSIYL